MAKKRVTRRPGTKELLALLYEQDSVIEGLIELCEERGALIQQLRTPSLPGETSPGLNGATH